MRLYACYGVNSARAVRASGQVVRAHKGTQYDLKRKKKCIKRVPRASVRYTHTHTHLCGYIQRDLRLMIETLINHAVDEPRRRAVVYYFSAGHDVRTRRGVRFDFFFAHDRPFFRGNRSNTVTVPQRAFRSVIAAHKRHLRTF